jgi:hypothetical protein
MKLMRVGQVSVGPRFVSVGNTGNVSKRVCAKMFSHVSSRKIPNRQQNTLSVVIAGAILVWRTKISQSNWAINSRNNVRQSNLRSRASQDVSAANSAFGFHQASTFKRQQDLLQIRLRKRRSFSDITHRSRTCRFGVDGERKQGSTGIVTSGRNAHIFIVGAGVWA